MFKLVSLGSSKEENFLNVFLNKGECGLIRKVSSGSRIACDSCGRLRLPEIINFSSLTFVFF
jgi:hypothetical protein